MARKRKPRGEPVSPLEPVESPPTEDTWRRTIDVFFVLRSLGSAVSRRRAEKLAKALDQEALDVLRVARRLENAFPPVLYLDELITKHSRSAIVTRLRDYTKRHVDFAQLDDLGAQIGRDVASWYSQGGQLLDAAERVRTNLAVYEYVDVHRPEGEPGTVAWSYLIEQAKRWGVSDGELARRLKDTGDTSAESDVFHLKDNVKKHRLRRKPPKPRKRRSKAARPRG